MAKRPLIVKMPILTEESLTATIESINAPNSIETILRELGTSNPNLAGLVSNPPPTGIDDALPSVSDTDDLASWGSLVMYTALALEKAGPLPYIHKISIQKAKKEILSSEPFKTSVDRYLIQGALKLSKDYQGQDQLMLNYVHHMASRQPNTRLAVVGAFCTYRSVEIQLESNQAKLPSSASTH